MFLKRYEAGGATVGASHLKFLETLVLGLLDRVPKEKRHSAQSVEPCITATILVNHCLFVGNRQDTRHRPIVLGHNSDLQVFPKRGNQCAKPRLWLWWQEQSPTGDDQKLIELLQQYFRCPFLVFQPFPLGSSNLSLNTTFVEIVEQFLRASSAQIETMKTIRKTLAETGQTARLIERGPDLDVLPAAGVDIVPHIKEQVIQLA